MSAVGEPILSILEPLSNEWKFFGPQGEAPKAHRDAEHGPLIQSVT